MLAAHPLLLPDKLEKCLCRSGNDPALLPGKSGARRKLRLQRQKLHIIVMAVLLQTDHCPFPFPDTSGVSL